MKQLPETLCAEMLAVLDGGHSISSASRIHKALKSLDTAQPAQVNAMLVEALELALNSHGKTLMSNPPQDMWLVYGVEPKARAALTAAKQAQPECGYDDTTGNCTRANCCKQAQPEPINQEMLKALKDVLETLKSWNNGDDLVWMQYRLPEIIAKAQAQPEPSKYGSTELQALILDKLQQAQPEPHLFELWWAEYMPEATQEQAFKAWSAAPSSKGVSVEQQAQPERAPLSEDAIVEMVTPESFPFICKKVPLGEVFNFAKAVLAAAHGIKQGGQQCSD